MIMLRDPTERLHSSFWYYEHYQKKYGATEEGFSEYAAEMVGHFRTCTQARADPRRLQGASARSPLTLAHTLRPSCSKCLGELRSCGRLAPRIREDAIR